VPVAAMFVNDREKMSNPDREPSIYASYQVSVHLAKRFQRPQAILVLNWSISKNLLL
jgi:hypothetical protein